MTSSPAKAILSKKLETLKRLISINEDEINKKNEKISLKQSEKATLDNQIAELNIKTQDLESKIAHQEKINRELAEKLRETSEQTHLEERTLNSAINRLTGIEGQINQYVEEIKIGQNAAEDLKRRREENLKKMEQTKEKLHSTKVKVESEAKRLAEAENILFNTMKEFKKKQCLIEKESERKEAFNAEFTSITKHLNEVQTRIEAARLEKLKLEENFSILEEKRQKAQSKCASLKSNLVEVAQH